MTYNQSVGMGSGFLYFTPLSGTSITPVRVALLQGIDFEMSWEEKPLYGQNQWAAAIANGKAKGSLKAKNATIDSGAAATILLNGSPGAGQNAIADLEAHSVPGTGPYTVTVTPPGSGTFESDKGVFYATTGQPLTKVTSGAIVGQYSQSGGVYTFAAADTGVAVLICYEYTLTGGFKTTITNQPMGTSNYFQADLFQNNPEVSGSQWGMRLYRCKSNKLALSLKQDDWTIPDFEASIQANAAGNVLDFNTPA